jgi:hypothetical protein
MPVDESVIAAPPAMADSPADRTLNTRLRGYLPDTLALTLIFLLAGLFALRVVDWGVTPFEDAAMLMRYADNIAHGHGVVWNVGDAPVDGGTDFLFMILVAAVRSMGFSIETATQLVSAAAHFATLLLIYLGMRRIQGAGCLPAFLSAAYFAVCPGLVLAAAYFGTPFFAFAVALAWLLAQRIMLEDQKRIRDMLYFSLACLVAGRCSDAVRQADPQIGHGIRNYISITRWFLFRVALDVLRPPTSKPLLRQGGRAPVSGLAEPFDQEQRNTVVPFRSRLPTIGSIR